MTFAQLPIYYPGLVLVALVKNRDIWSSALLTFVCSDCEHPINGWYDSDSAFVEWVGDELKSTANAP